MNKYCLGFKKDTEFIVYDETVARYSNILMGELTTYFGIDKI